MNLAFIMGFHPHVERNPQPVPRQPQAAIRAAFALAARLAVCAALGLGSRQSRREADDRGQLPQGQETLAHCETQARRVGSAAIVLATAALPVRADDTDARNVELNCQTSCRISAPLGATLPEIS